MTGSKLKPTPALRLESVEVVVVVNHDDLRRGERGVVELTEVVRARLDKGYLRLAEPADAVPSGPALGSRADRGGGREPLGALGALLGVAGAPAPMVLPVSRGGGGGSDTRGTVHPPA